MANEQHLKILKQGVDAWNQWRRDNADIQPDLGFLGQLPNEADLEGVTLHGADLGRTNLIGASLEGMDLREANFRLTNLSGAWLGNANLHEVDLSMANLYEAELPGAKLVGAILSKADLSRANLCGANLFGAHLPRASLQEANLQDVDLRGADLWRTDLTEADLTGAEMFGANLTQAQLVGTNLSKANLASCQIFGISAWGLNLSECVQTELVITPIDEPIITVDNLEVGQFIYLLLHNERIRDVINTITTKVVLILGRFTPERRAVLDAIRDELRKHDLLPVLFDFDKPTTRDTHETVTTLARLARFVIADITNPKSVPQELVSTVETLPSVPVQPILELGSEPWGMYDHIKRYPWVLAIHHYRDVDDLLTSLEESVIVPAEAKARELRID